MIDAVGKPQGILLLGGTSEIAQAVAEEYAKAGTQRVVLAARPSDRRDEAVARLVVAGLDVEVIDFDAEDTDSHEKVLVQAWASGDVDLAVVAFGLLGDQERAWQDHAAAVQLGAVNFVGAISVGTLLAERMRAQGHGVIVALSSVAGERVRRSNFVYGATKAGMDGFFTGLGDAVRSEGVHVLVVRPGFVSTRMTHGLKPAPLATTADAVARDVLVAVAERKEVIWVPGALRPVMSALRHVPRPLFRRLPL